MLESGPISDNNILENIKKVDVTDDNDIKYILEMIPDAVKLFKKNEQFETIGRVWRYQRGNQNLYIEEEQKTQW